MSTRALEMYDVVGVGFGPSSLSLPTALEEVRGDSPERRITAAFFVSYLHSVGRLAQFVNNKDFFPTRREFHDYLEWAAARVTDYVTYNTEVTGIGFFDSGPRAGAQRRDRRLDPEAPGGTGTGVRHGGRRHSDELSRNDIPEEGSK